MTVSNTTNRVTYTANGTNKIFAYPFRIFAKTDLVVYNAGALQTLDVDYTVTGVGQQGGGNINFTRAPANGNTIIIYRELPITQLTDYQEGDSFPAETHEIALDRLCMIAQQLSESMERALKLSNTSTLTDIEVPVGANKGIRWNSAGDNFELFTVDTNSTSVITTKGDMIFGTTDGVPERLPIGAEGEVLRVKNNTPDWEQPSGWTGVRGSFSNLLIKPATESGASSYQLVITADSVVMQEPTDKTYYEALDVNVTLDLGISGAGGLDTGSLANATWYFIWLIYNPTTATVNALASLSSSTPIMPDGYIYKKLLGAVRNIGRIIHLHFDSDLTDQSGKTWTAYGNAQITTSDKKFGAGSLLLDGAGDYIDTPDHGDFTLAQKDFTIEAWIKFNGSSGIQYQLCGQGGGSSSNSSFNIVRGSDNYLKGGIYDGTNSYIATSSTTFTDTTSWHHVAFVRKGYLIKLFVDGVQGPAVSVFNVTVLDVATAVSIGRFGTYDGEYWSGKVDEFSFTVGLAKYWENFTPPTSAYANLGEILPFIQIDREAQLSYLHKVGNDFNLTTTTSLSLATVVPATVTKGVGGKAKANVGASTWYIAPTTFPNGLVYDNNFAIGYYFASGDATAPWSLPILLEDQTLYHQVTANSVDIWVGNYTLRGV